MRQTIAAVSSCEWSARPSALNYVEFQLEYISQIIWIPVTVNATGFRVYLNDDLDCD